MVIDFLRQFVSSVRSPDLENLSSTEKIVLWTAALTPLWWLLGIQPLFYPAVSAVLFLQNLTLNKLIRKPFPAFIWVWFLMCVVACITMMLGLDEMGAGLTAVAAGLVTLFKSYFMIFAFLCLPFLTRIRSQVVTRAITFIAIGILCNLVMQMGSLAVGVNNVVYVPPLAQAIPGRVSSSLLVKSAKFADFFGLSLPRTILHTADPPILGLCSVLCFLVCLTEKNSLLRRLSLIGALSGLAISFSRSAWLGFGFSLLLTASFKFNLARQIPLFSISIVLWVSSFMGMTLNQLLEMPRQLFDSARASSSETRALVVQKTLEAWQEKIWLGWGVIRGQVWLYETTYIGLGSFSTYSAVLYLNGLIGFIVFISALLLTLVKAYTLAINGNLSCQIAFSGFLTLCILIQATPLSWMAIYLWFFFLWIGSVVAETEQNVISYSRWEQLITPSPDI
ncbi:MAG: O-antigen ligase family protein [Cyanobacteria bacterium J06635_15]